MKWGKCIDNKVDYLTKDKIYEISESNEGTLCVTNDFNQITYFSAYSDATFYIGTWFKDATSEIRDNKIKQILKKKF